MTTSTVQIAGDRRHCVPQFLLGRFLACDLPTAAGNKVHVVELVGDPAKPRMKRIHPEATKSIAKAGRIDGVLFDSDEADAFHKGLEDGAAPAVDAIVAGQNFPLNDRLAHAFFDFMAQQFTRTPRGRLEAAASARMEMARWVSDQPEFQARARQLGADRLATAFGRWLSTLAEKFPASQNLGIAHGGQLREPLKQGMWKVVRTEEDSYITSDHPCVWLDDRPDDIGPHCFFVLSPRCLVIGCLSERCPGNVVHVGFPEHINKLTVLRAQRQAYASTLPLANAALVYAESVQKKATSLSPRTVTTSPIWLPDSLSR